LEYVKHSISVSLLAECVYCEAKVSNKQLLGEIETPIKVEGSRLHERDAKKALRKFGPTKKAKVVTLEDAMLLSYANVTHGLKRGKVVVNGEKKVLFMSIIPSHGIFGVPDFIDCKNGKYPIITDTKNAERIPSYPWPNDTIQVVAYSMGLEVLGFKPPYAVVEYVTRDKTRTKNSYQVPINESNKNRTITIAQRVFSLLQGSDPNPTTNTNKCVPCEYKAQCKCSRLNHTPPLSKAIQSTLELNDIRLERRDDVISEPNGRPFCSACNRMLISGEAEDSHVHDFLKYDLTERIDLRPLKQSTDQVIKSSRRVDRIGEEEIRTSLIGR
jgi:CRISPR/Cas system-associated exonuclease Cas4 (RecB family)